jgi:murein DD-endopeptidase MepM/ murein hydrolase activator NlpD
MSWRPVALFFGGLYALRRFVFEEGCMPTWHPTPRASDWSGWVWPVPVWNGRAPEVSDGYSRTKTAAHRKHLGADIMFRRREGDPVGLPYSSTNYTSQGPNTPIVAAGSGVIWDASLSPRGWQITIDHDKAGVLTYYQHLASFARDWSKGDRVAAGEQLGLMGGDISAGANPVYHLHFELLFPRAGETRDCWTADPLPFLRLWPKRAFGGVLA